MLHEERDFATNRHEQCGLVVDNTALVGCQCVQARAFKRDGRDWREKRDRRDMKLEG